MGPQLQWWVPTVAGHRRMLCAAGFEVLRQGRPYSVPFGPAHPARRPTARTFHLHLVRKLLTGHAGVPHAAVLARPRA